MTNNQDIFWKEALDCYFQNAIAFFFPQIYQDVDWSKGFEFLDKELEKIARDNEVGRKIADKLVKVFLADGSETWLLIHIEVQGYQDSSFEKRMYIYNYRIFDRYEVEVISLALLTDTHPNYRPHQYQVSRWGFKYIFQFPTVKLLDYHREWDTLESNPNPFGLVVMAFLKSQQESSGLGQLNWKVKLVKLLYERKYSRKQVRQLFGFIDWALNLPEELELVFRDEVSKLEETNKMAYVTSIERMGIKKGLEEGLEKGREEGLEKGREEGLREGTLVLALRLLKRRLGEFGGEIEQQVKALPLEKLEILGEALLDFTRLDDLTAWLEHN